MLLALLSVASPLQAQLERETRFFTGVGAGPEMGVALFLPKVSVYNFHPREGLTYFYGVEATSFVFFVTTLSADVSVGLQRGAFTLETSAGYLNYSQVADGFEQASQATINPKLGLQLKQGQFWFRMGPSFLVYANHPSRTSGLIDPWGTGNPGLNLELLFLLGTTKRSEMQWSRAQETFEHGRKLQFYAGIGGGPDMGLSILVPKISRYTYFQRKSFTPFLGAEVTVGLVSGFTIALNASAGLKKGPVTLETGASILWQGEDNKYDMAVHSTINPKLGVQFAQGRFWLRGGPAVFLFKAYPDEVRSSVDPIQINGNSVNLEFLIRLGWKRGDWKPVN